MKIDIAHDVVIVGAGSAGLTAGIYCARAGLKTLILEKVGVGGQLIKIDIIENYPGFPEGINGFELLEKIKKQAERFGVKVESEEVENIERPGTKGQGLPSFELNTKSGKRYPARSIILATGWSPKRLGIKGEEELQGKGISYCATCDGPMFRNREIALIGGGDTAVSEAIYLTKFVKKLTLVHRRDKLRATKILQDRLMKANNVEIKWDSVATEIAGSDRVSGLKIKNVKTGEESNILAQGVFLFVGIDPNTDFLKGKIGLDEKEFITTDEHMKTSLDGIFACGDARRNPLKQVVTACSEGAIAAYSCYHYLDSQ